MGLGDLISWGGISIISLFTFVLVPWVLIGAISGFILGEARGGKSGASAAWCALLGPFGWLLTLALTSEARGFDSDSVQDLGDSIKDLLPDGLTRAASTSKSDDLSDLDLN